MSHAPSHTLERRHRAIRAAMAVESLDALVITALPNVLYLTNFGGSSALVVITADRLTFVTDSRYVADVSATRGSDHECPGRDLVVVESSYDLTLAGLLAALPSARIGFEAAHVPVSRYRWLEKTVRRTAGAKGEAERTTGEGTRATTSAPDLVSTEGLVERARVRKDAYELTVLREAAHRLSSVASALVADVRPGRSEREIAMAIDWRIREAGFERPAFETIVAAGPNAALPHARPSERKLIEGDLVVLDFGGVYDSYCVDLTRTVAVGRASTRAREVYQAVLTAHDLAIAAVAPGVSRFAIDDAARQSLAAAGMSEAFGHGTGHGLGIEVHEEPRISRRQPEAGAGADGKQDVKEDDRVAPGMVFTIEPGAYFPGWSGVRIEDDVLVTDAGVELLTQVTTDLLEI